MATGERLSLIVPSWREGVALLAAVRLARVALAPDEAIVVAAEEPDEVREAATAEGVRWVDAPRPCRGAQLRTGARAATGDVLVFVHANSRLPPDAGRLVRAALANGRCVGGAFRLRFDRPHPVLNLLARLSKLRVPSAFLGDQCLFCRRGDYDAVGGFTDQPLFEDVDLARRLARRGPLLRLPQAVTTSARRFTASGPLRRLVLNALLMCAFQAGVSPARLHRWYTHRSPSGS